MLLRKTDAVTKVFCSEQKRMSSTSPFAGATWKSYPAVSGRDVQEPKALLRPSHFWEIFMKAALNCCMFILGYRRHIRILNGNKENVLWPLQDIWPCRLFIFFFFSEYRLFFRISFVIWSLHTFSLKVEYGKLWIHFLGQFKIFCLKATSFPQMFVLYLRHRYLHFRSIASFYLDAINRWLASRGSVWCSIFINRSPNFSIQICLNKFYYSYRLKGSCRTKFIVYIHEKFWYKSRTAAVRKPLWIDYGLTSYLFDSIFSDEFHRHTPAMLFYTLIFIGFSTIYGWASRFAKISKSAAEKCEKVLL